MSTFVNASAQAALRDAVEAVEGRSAVEVVISVRSSSSSYLHVDLALGALGGLGGLLYALYAERVFPLHTIPLVVVAGFAAGALLSVSLRPLRRLLGTRGVETCVAQAARAQFFDLGVSNTRQRSGMLIYVSLFEARCQVLVDSGLRQALPAETLEQLVQRIEASLGGRTNEAGARALAQAVSESAETLARHLPRAADDVDELPDLQLDPKLA